MVFLPYVLRLLTILALLPAATIAQAQSIGSSSWAWTKILEEDQVQLSYIFYAEADNVNNGIVLRLDNSNDHAVQYSFTAIFRAEEAQVEERVAGMIGPRALVTGDVEGLFFIPFLDGRAIVEIGIRGFRTAPVEG